MLTEVKAYSSWPSAPTLLLSESGRPETDLIQLRNIDGLNPVNANVNMSPFGSVDGEAYVGSSVASRNIILTVHPNPDWDVWTYESLRRLIYMYFMPKSPLRLEFFSDDMPTVDIIGIVESVEVNQFSKDPEYLVSVICPDPYFTAIVPKTATGQSIRAGDTVDPVVYNGNIPAGIHVELDFASGTAPANIGVQIGDPGQQYFNVGATVSTTKYFEMNSLPMQKWVRNVDRSSGVISNLLSKMQQGSSWPTLDPGENDFSIVTDAGVQDWTLTYFERYGGL